MCTNVTLIAADNSVVVGRSMEDAAPMLSHIFFRSRGFQYTQNLAHAVAHRTGDLASAVEISYILPSQLLTWTGEYAVMGLNALGTDIFCHGMNDQGLVAGDMTLSVSEYQSYTGSDSNLLVYPYFINWVLSMHATCEELKNNLAAVRVINPFEDMPKGFLFHFPVIDATGHSIVIEFIDGVVQVHDNDPASSGLPPAEDTVAGIPISGVTYRPGVLTNDPVFPWHIANLTNYGNITPHNHSAREGTAFTVDSPSQGTGFIGLPGSSTPADRFIRAAMMNNYAFQPVDADRAINLAAHIMNTVDIPWGTSRGTNVDTGDYTQWIAISDAQQLRFYVRDYTSPQMFLVDFAAVLAAYQQDPTAIDTLTLDFVSYDLAIDITPVPE